ncbi:unnamed protein product, partial [Symbiodinium sp. CCMP2456]
MATALSDEVDVEGQAEDQTEANDVIPGLTEEDQVEGQAEDQTEANDFIPGLTEEDQVEGQAEDQTEANDVIPGLTEDVANEPVSPPNRWNQDICVICHGEMKQDQALEALVCGHLFHRDCINRYCDTTGRDK